MAEMEGGDIANLANSARNPKFPATPQKATLQWRSGSGARVRGGGSPEHRVGTPQRTLSRRRELGGGSPKAGGSPIRIWGDARARAGAKIPRPTSNPNPAAATTTTATPSSPSPNPAAATHRPLMAAPRFRISSSKETSAMSPRSAPQQRATSGSASRESAGRPEAEAACLSISLVRDVTSARHAPRAAYLHKARGRPFSGPGVGQTGRFEPESPSGVGSAIRRFRNGGKTRVCAAARNSP